MYLIGVDGGGTKTDCLITDLDGIFIAKSTTGSSNLRSVGMEKATISIANAIKDAFSKTKNKEISMAFIGIPAFKEEYGEKEEEIRDLIFDKLDEVSILKENIIISSDQEVAFRSGTEEKDGVVVISGTGSVARGWNKEKDIKTGGWGWLTDSGGSFQIGKKACRKTIEALDGRIEKTVLTDLVLDYFQIKNINELNKIIYKNNPVETISPLSLIVDKSAKKGDSIAEQILIEESLELARSAKNTIERLDFEGDFPLVLVGSTFKSDLFLSTFKEKIIYNFKTAKIIMPEEDPVTGAVKLAREIFYKK